MLMRCKKRERCGLERRGLIAYALIGLFALLGLAALSIAGAQAWSAPDTIEDRPAAVAALIHEAHFVTGAIARTVELAMVRTRLIAADPEQVRALRAGDAEALTDLCNAMIRNSTEIDAVAMFDDRGEILAINTVYADGRAISPDRVASARSGNHQDLPVVRRCLALIPPRDVLEFQRCCTILPSYFGSSGPAVAHSAPVLDPATGEVIGIVSTRMRFDRLTRILAQTSVAGGHGALHLVADDGSLFSEGAEDSIEPGLVARKHLEALVRPLASGQADHALVKCGDQYICLYAMDQIETVESGGIHVMISAPESWVEHESLLLHKQRASITGLAGLLALSLAAAGGCLARSSEHSKAVACAQDRFERAVHGATDGLWDWDIASGEVWYSNRFKELLGFKSHEFEDFPHRFEAWFERLHVEDRDSVRSAIRSHFEGRGLYDVQYRVMAQSGEYRWFRARGEATRDVDGRPLRMAGSIHDITEQRRIEQELRESESRLQRERALLADILSTLPFFVFWKDRESRYLGCNQAFARAAGCDSPEQIVGKTDFDLPWGPTEAMFYRADDEEVMATGRPKLHIEESQHQADGRTVTLSTSKVPLRNNDGETIGVIGIFMDITERKRLETQLAQAQKLESIGQLAAGIAHEINTPTQFISDNVRFLRDNFDSMLGVIDSYASQLDPDAPPRTWEERVAEIRSVLEILDYDFLRTEIPQAIEQSLDGLDRVATIVRAMKDFSHPARADKELADINRAIESTTTVCRNRWKYVADLELDLDETIPAVRCFAAEVNQVILNLVVNSADAIGERFKNGGGEKGLIRVSTRRCGESVEIRVFDNGPGIPPEIRDRIFDPFFTTKEVGTGTGQGLAICRHVITQKHAGTIECSSTPGEGAEFVVRLPLESEPAAARCAA